MLLFPFHIFKLTLFGPWYVSYGLYSMVLSYDGFGELQLHRCFTVFSKFCFHCSMILAKPSVETFRNLAHIYSRKVNFHVLIFISFLFLVSFYTFFKKHNSHTKFVRSRTKLVWSLPIWHKEVTIYLRIALLGQYVFIT